MSAADCAAAAGQDGIAPGAPLMVLTASLIAGSATGAATVSGATLMSAASGD
jgi:hypothetical protein